jgi:thioredoxin-related protein
LKRISIIIAFVLLASPQAFASPWLKSLSAAQKQAKEEKALIFVDLFADWCGWCHQLEQQVFPSESFQKATNGYVLLRLNTEDGADGTKLAQKFQVSSLPTSLILTSDMTVAGMIKGFLPADAFSKVVTDTEKGFNEFQKRASNESAIANDFQKRLELAREYRVHYANTKAIARFKKLVADPKTPGNIRDQAYFDLAVTQFMEKQFDDSMKTIQDFSKVQKAGESYERSLLLLGEIYYVKGNYLSSVNELKNFKTKFPQSQFMGQVNMMLPEVERALAGSRVQ